MAGFFDSLGGGLSGLADPSGQSVGGIPLPLLGVLQGLGEAAEPSRTPVSTASVFGKMAAGLMQGQQAAQQAQMTGADIALKKMQLARYEAQRKLLGDDAFGAPAAAGPTTDASGATTPADTTTPAAGATPATTVATATPAPATTTPAATDATTPDASAAPTGTWDRSTAVDFFNNHVAGWEGSKLVTDSNGHPVKYGINGKYYGDANIPNMTQDKAANIFADIYANKVPAGSSVPLAMAYSDTAFMSGQKFADKLLAASGGDPEKFLQGRQAHLDALAADPSGKWTKYAKTWTDRTNQLRDAMGLGGAPAAAATDATAGGGTPPAGGAAAPAGGAAADTGPATNSAGMPIPKPGQSLQEYVRALPLYKRQALAMMDPDTMMSQLIKDMNAPRELTGADRDRWLAAHKDMNPHDTYMYDPSTGQVTVGLKSGLKSKQEEQQAIDEATAAAEARAGGPLAAFIQSMGGADNVKEYIHKLATYQLPFNASVGGSRGGAAAISAYLMQGVLAENPNYRPDLQKMIDQTIQGYGPTGKLGGTMTAKNAALNHMDMLLAAWQEFKDHGKTEAFNRISNQIQTQFGSSALPAKLDLLGTFVSNEIVKAIQQTSGEAERTSMKAQLDPARATGIVTEVARTAQGLLAGQLRAQEDGFVGAVRDAMPEAQARQFFREHYLGQHARDLLNSGAGEGTTATPAAATVPPPQTPRQKMLPHPKTPADAAKIHGAYIDGNGFERVNP